MTQITDIWFRTPLALEALAEQLQLQRIVYDCENHWEWVSCSMGRHRLNITRTHTVPAARTDTAISLVGAETRFSSALQQKVTSRLLALGIAPIYLGCWIYLHGEEFDKQVLERLG